MIKRLLLWIIIKLGIRPMYKWKLTDTFEYKHKLLDGINVELGYASFIDGKIIINNGYAWNGCSPMFSVLDLFILKTPDGIIDIKTGKQKAYYASLVHDALYQYKPISRKNADKIFYELLKDSDFIMAKPYYYAVRLLGPRWKQNKYN